MAELMTELSEQAYRLGKGSLPADVVHHAKRAVLDWLGATVAGAATPEISQLVRANEEDIGRGRAWLMDGRTATTRAAAMINGASSHVLELDDIFRDGLYHPGGPVIAAALAVAAETQASGAAFLRAVVAGYEVSTRISALVNPVHYRHWHTTGTVGCMGAAVAASCLYDLNPGQMADAIAHATTFASGLQQAFRSSAATKPLHVAHAADVGVWTARAAAQGLSGAHDILEGPAGFGAAMSDSPDWRGATAELGERFNVRAITFKAYACCGQTFAAIDALLALKEQADLQPADFIDQIERIDVQLAAQALALVANSEPKDALEARFSLAFVMASTLLYGPPLLAAFTPARLTDPAIRRWLPRVHGYVDAEINRVYPRQRSARVTLHLRDGSRREWFQENRRGDPEWPLDDAALEAKFLGLITPLRGAQRAQRLLGFVSEMEKAPNLAGLHALLHEADSVEINHHS